MQVRPAAPVVGLSSKSLTRAHERPLAHVAEADLALLVRHRWDLTRAQGWAMMSSFAVIFAAGLMLAVLARQGWLLAIYVALLISTSIGLGFVAEAGAHHLFRQKCRTYGLSDDAMRSVYLRAGEAEPWASVLRASVGEPTDAQIAAFVRPPEREAT